MPQDRGKVLLVRHGPGRGRVRPYMEFGLDHLRVHHPSAYQRLILHETGMAQPSLDGIRGVIFLLADPLREMYPDCFDEARRIEEAARARGAAVVNPPAALSNSIKDRQAALWRDARVPTPEVRSFATREELLALAGELTFPVVVRGSEQHSQRGLHFCPTRESLLALKQRRMSLPGVVSPFVDSRARRGSPGDPWSRFYHQKRAFVIGDAVCFHHLYFSAAPIVTSNSCTFARHWGWRERVYPVSRELQRCIEEDVRFGRHGDGHADLMRRAAAALGFGYCGFDYATLPNGDPVIFECNPYFTLSPLHKAALPRRRGLEERYARYWQALAALIERLGSTD